MAEEESVIPPIEGEAEELPAAEEFPAAEAPLEEAPAEEGLEPPGKYWITGWYRSESNLTFLSCCSRGRLFWRSRCASARWGRRGRRVCPS